MKKAAAFLPAAMETSIRKMMDLVPDYLYITHCGPVVAAPDAVARLPHQVQGFGALLPVLPELGHDPACRRGVFHHLRGVRGLPRRRTTTRKAC
jgi:hypothetical protein